MATKVLKKSKPQGVAAKIRPLGDSNRFLTMLCYGKANTGKTVFSCSFPKPLLLVDIKEEGEDSVTDVEGDIIHIEEWQELEDLYWELRDGDLAGKYKSLVLDQLTAMQALGMAKIRADIGQKPNEVFSQRSWGRLSGLMQEWIYNFRELKKRQMHICFNAHERLRESDQEDDDRIAPSVGSNLMSSVASFVNGAVSVIGNTFIREEYDKKAKTTDYKYCMRLGPHAYYATKIRRPVSAGPPPSVLENPSFDKVFALTAGGNPEVRKVRKVKR